MGLNTGFIAIKGQHLDAIADIAAHFRLTDKKQDELLNNWTEAEAVFEEEFTNTGEGFTERHIAWYQNGWTVLEDLTFILCTNEKALQEISTRFTTAVLSVLTQGTSNCFGFWYFEKTGKRIFFIEDGVVTTNAGEPLPGEEKYNINEKAFYNDVHGVAKELGIDWHASENYPPFIIKTLEANDDYKAELETSLQQYQQQLEEGSAAKKPWWKFW